MKTISLRQSKIHFPGKSGNDILSIFADSRVFLICDTQTKKHCLPVFQKLTAGLSWQSYVMPDGESSKSLKETDRIVNFFLEHHVNRNDIVVALGGGVVCDITGFVCSVYKRGVRCAYFPTTLLAMVDAAIGGKNGIDFKGIKNIFGTFYDPESVVIFPPFLKTLDSRHLASGKAEIIKTLLLGDTHDWKTFQVNDQIPDMRLIQRCAEIKATFVEKDYYDRNERHALNFGHTIGHAMEAYSISRHPIPLLHGEAVAAGIVCESFLSHRQAKLTKNELNEISDLVKSIFKKLPDDCLRFENLKGFMQHDKKNAKPGTPLFTLLDGPGKPVIKREIPVSLIKESLAYYHRLYG